MNGPCNQADARREQDAEKKDAGRYSEWTGLDRPTLRPYIFRQIE